MKLSLRIDGFNARLSRMRAERTRENAIRAALEMLAEQERRGASALVDHTPPEPASPRARS